MDYFHTIKLHKIKYLGPDCSAFGTQEKYILKKKGPTLSKIALFWAHIVLNGPSAPIAFERFRAPLFSRTSGTGT